MSENSIQGSGAVRGTFELLTTVAGPIGLAGALLYYIGLVDSHEYYSYFGVDDGLIGFSITDYVARSADVVLPTTVIAVTAVMMFFFIHLLSKRLPRVISSAVRRFNWPILLSAAAAVALTVGLLGFALTREVSGWQVAFLLMIMTAVLIIESVAMLTEKIYEPPQVPTSPANFTPARRVTVALTIFLVALIVISAEATSRARARAAAAASDLRSLPAVVVFSEKDLAISGDGIQAQKLTVIGSQFTFRYSGLRLLAEGDNGIVLLPDRWRRGTGNAIFLHQDGRMRIDFVGK